MKPTGQKPFYYYLFFVLMLLGCENVVDQELDMLEGGISAASSPQSVLTGDSLTVSGRLQLEDQSPVITLGGVEADYVSKGSEVRDDRTTKATYTVETVRFLVTPAMGEGRQPLEIQSGDHNQTLYVDILSRAELDSRPDTTLVVEELYRGPGGNSYGEFTGRTVTDEGVIYLQTSEGFYRYQDGLFQNLLAIDDPLSIDGEEVRIKRYITREGSTIGDAFAGVAVNADNSTMYLSLYTDMSGEEDYTGAWLLLKTTPDLNHFKIINRTWHRHSIDTVWNSSGTAFRLREVNSYSPSVVLDNGPVENTQLRAQRMHVDAQNRLLFYNNSLSGQYSENYYARLEANGRITSFADNDNNGIYYTPDGTQAFVIGEEPGGHPRSNPVTLFDLELMEPSAHVPARENWNLISFEENPEWQFEENFRMFLAGSEFLGLPNGELLSLLGTSPSIGALNPAGASIYTFAGIEKGYDSRSDAWVSEQNQVDGLAKYVNFSSFELPDGSRTGNASFIGMDKRNDIYFLRGGVGSGDNFIPLRIYRLGKP